MTKRNKGRIILSYMLSLLIIAGTLFSICGCNSSALPTINVPVNTMLPNHVEYEERMKNFGGATFNWESIPNTLLEMRENKEYEFLAEVQIGRYQRCYANGELDGISIFTATITKVFDALDKKMTPKEGTVILLVQGSTPKSAKQTDYLYEEGEKYVLSLHLCDEEFYEQTDTAMSEELHTVRQDYPVLHSAYGIGVDTLRIVEIDGKEYAYVVGFGEREFGMEPDEHFLAGLNLELADAEITEKVCIKLGENEGGFEYASVYPYEDFIAAVDALK